MFDSVAHLRNDRTAVVKTFRSNSTESMRRIRISSFAKCQRRSIVQRSSCACHREHMRDSVAIINWTKLKFNDFVSAREWTLRRIQRPTQRQWWRWTFIGNLYSQSSTGDDPKDRSDSVGLAWMIEMSDTCVGVKRWICKVGGSDKIHFYRISVDRICRLGDVAFFKTIELSPSLIKWPDVIANILIFPTVCCRCVFTLKSDGNKMSRRNKLVSVVSFFSFPLLIYRRMVEMLSMHAESFQRISVTIRQHITFTELRHSATILPLRDHKQSRDF